MSIAVAGRVSCNTYPSSQKRHESVCDFRLALESDGQMKLSNGTTIYTEQPQMYRRLGLSVTNATIINGLSVTNATIIIDNCVCDQEKM